jgi:GNAT superfamily N-acetyltransferase
VVIVETDPTISRATIRPGRERDLEAIDAVLASTEDAGPEVPPMPPGGQQPYLRHLLVRGTVAVAELDGRVIGFGAAVTTERATHLADLSVVPEHQGRRLGGRLFRAVMGESVDRTTFASDDPRAMPTYIRGGMLPRWPNLIMTGQPELLSTAGDVVVEAAVVAELVRLEREWLGIDRSLELPYWAVLPEPVGWVARRHGHVVATGLGRNRVRGDGRWLDRALAGPGVDASVAVAAFVAALAFVGVPGKPIGASIPGPSPLVRVLLDRGFRIADRDTFLSSAADMVDPVRTIVNSGVL